jgi:cytidylate kinase
MARKPLVICICGMAGSGKSTLAKKLAEKYGLKYYSGGDALKALAIKKGHKPVEHGWWESKEGLSFLEKREKNLEFDKAVDQKLLEIAKQGNVVLDSWTMPWLLENGFKIWLEASPRKRAERVAKRDNITVKEALKVLRKKEKKTKSIYEEPLRLQTRRRLHPISPNFGYGQLVRRRSFPSPKYGSRQADFQQMELRVNFLRL